MDVLGWLWWLVASFVGLLWSVIWFLLGGWVSTLAQIAVLVLVVFGYKYGWRRAPQELLARLGTFGRFSWAWLRAREPSTYTSQSASGPSTARRRALDRRQPGDIRINISTCLTLLMFLGLWLLAAL